MSNQSEYTSRALNESDIAAELDSQIKEVLVSCFAHRKKEFSKCRWLNNNMPDFTSIVEYQGRVIGHAAVIERMITASDVTVRAAGIANVGVIPGYRSKGIVDIVLKAAMDEMKHRNFDIGLLFCQSRIKYVYLRNGWTDLPEMSVECLVNGQPGHLPADRHKMFLPLNMTEIPGESLDLNGPRW